MLSSTWTMSTRGSQQVEIAGVNDNQQITAMSCGCTHHTTPKRRSNEAMMIDYIKNIIIPYVECQ